MLKVNPLETRQASDIFGHRIQNLYYLGVRTEYPNLRDVPSLIEPRTDATRVTRQKAEIENHIATASATATHRFYFQVF